MRILNKKMIRNIKGNKVSYILCVLLIVLSTAMYTGFRISKPQIKDSIEAFKKIGKVEDASFKTVNGIDNISDIEKRFNLVIEEMKWKDFKLESGLTIRVFRDRKRINMSGIQEGEDLSSSGDIVINKSSAASNRIKIGDNIKLDGMDLRVSGFASYVDYMYLLENKASIVGNMDSFSIATISPEDFNKIEGFSSKYSVVFNDDNMGEFKAYIKGRNGIIEWISRDENIRIKAINADIEGFFSIGDYLPFMILIIVSILISIVIQRLINSEIDQLGALYALGYSRFKLMIHYLTYPIMITFTGGVIGQVPGFLLTNILKWLITIQHEIPRIDLHVDFKVLLISMIIPVFIVIPINAIVIYKELKSSPVDLMNGKIRESKITNFEKGINISFLNFNNKFILRNLVRNKYRAIITVVTITFASSLLFLIFMINNSFRSVMNDGFKKSYKYEYMYLFKEPSFIDVEGERFWKIGARSLDRDGKEISFTLDSMEEDAGLLQVMGLKNEKLSFENNIISEDLARKMGVKPLDTIIISSDTFNTVLEIKIDKISRGLLGDVVYVPLDRLYSEGVVPYKSYIGVLSQRSLDIDKKLLESTMKREYMLESIKRVINPLSIVMYIVGIITSTLSVGLIYIIVSMLVLENKVNIYILKIMGYPQRRIDTMILNVNNYLVLIGFLISIPISKLYIGNIFRRITENMQFSLEDKITPGMIGMVFIIVITIYMFAREIGKGKIKHGYLD